MKFQKNIFKYFEVKFSEIRLKSENLHPCIMETNAGSMCNTYILTIVPSTVTDTLDLLDRTSTSRVRGGSTADLMFRGAGFPSKWLGTTSVKQTLKST